MDNWHEKRLPHVIPFPENETQSISKTVSPVIKAGLCGPPPPPTRGGDRIRYERMQDACSAVRGARSHGNLLGPRGLGTFHEAKTNRLCVDLFWSHSCKQRINEDVWCSAPRRSVHQAAALVPVCLSLLIPAEPGMSSSSDPLGLFPSYKFSSFPNSRDEGRGLWGLASNSLNALSFQRRAASSWCLALLISISDLLGTGTFIIQGKSG